MFIAKVVGSTVSTQKVDSMVGHKLLVIEPYRVDPETRSSMKTTGRTLVAADTMGAGENEYVLVVQGSSARMTPETKNLPGHKISAAAMELRRKMKETEHGKASLS